MIDEKFSILYVDDEENNLTSFKAAFRRDFKVHTAVSAREGIKVLRANPVQLIVTDQRMPEMTGVQFLEAVIPEYPDAIRIILTGFSDVEAIIKAINTGRVYRYITKPWNETELKMTIKGALEIYNLQKRNRNLVEELHEKVKEQERIVKLFQRYVPENVITDALHTRDASLFESETRIVSVLFLDIRNFTRLSSNRDAKFIVAFLNDYFSIMTECVRANKGSVNKFIGDGLLAVFGAPLSYIENQENAVFCAMDMIEALKKVNDKYAEEFGQEVKVGVGIHTGEAVAGNVGSQDRVEYTVIGDTVNVASRIESLTKTIPNGILIGESTYNAVRHVIETKEWEAMEVKGKDEKIKVYEVIGKKDA